MLSLNHDVVSVVPENTLRLVPTTGGDETSGILQIFHDGEWGAICKRQFQRVDATVACKNLG